MIKQIGYVWQAQSWEYNYVFETEFNQNSKAISFKHTNFNNNQWDSIRFEKYFYDQNNNIIKKKRFSRIANAWMQTGQNEYQYDLSYPISDIWFPYPDIYYNKVLYQTFNKLYNGTSYPILDSTTYYYSSAPVGVSEVELSRVNIYPNPASSILIIELELVEKNQLTILDLTGKIIKTINFVGSKYSLTLNDLSNGIYIIQISNNSGLISKKFVKQ